MPPKRKDPESPSSQPHKPAAASAASSSALLAAARGASAVPPSSPPPAIPPAPPKPPAAASSTAALPPATLKPVPALTSLAKPSAARAKPSAAAKSSKPPAARAELTPISRLSLPSAPTSVVSLESVYTAVQELTASTRSLERRFASIEEAIRSLKSETETADWLASIPAFKSQIWESPIEFIASRQTQLAFIHSLPGVGHNERKAARFVKAHGKRLRSLIRHLLCDIRATLLKLWLDSLHAAGVQVATLDELRQADMYRVLDSWRAALAAEAVDGDLEVTPWYAACYLASRVRAALHLPPQVLTTDDTNYLVLGELLPLVNRNYTTTPHTMRRAPAALRLMNAADITWPAFLRLRNADIQAVLDDAGVLPDDATGATHEGGPPSPPSEHDDGTAAN